MKNPLVSNLFILITAVPLKVRLNKFFGIRCHLFCSRFHQIMLKPLYINPDLFTCFMKICHFLSFQYDPIDRFHFTK